MPDPTLGDGSVNGSVYWIGHLVIVADHHALPTITADNHSQIVARPSQKVQFMIPATAFIALEDVLLVRAGFLDWQQALRDGLPSVNGKWWLAHANAWAMLKSPGSKNKPVDLQDIKDVRLGRNDDMKAATVMINAPSMPGDENPQSTIARAPNGQRWLLRQGVLRSRYKHEIPIKQKQFDSVTRMEPVPVIAAADLGRTWYRVAMLDGSPFDIQIQTAWFVEHCALVRAHYNPPPGSSSAEADLRALLIGPPETAHVFEVPPQDAKFVEAQHGLVWKALNVRLTQAGIANGKPKSFGGYEADLAVMAPGKPLLVEIKTSVRASDVYAGVGQLTLYQRIMPWLQECELVLLLPTKPPPTLHAAVTSCGIRIATYASEGGSVFGFDSDFLGRCGLTV